MFHLRRSIPQTLLVAGLIAVLMPARSRAQIVLAGARSSGTVSSGEYAGQNFRLLIAGAYSGFGPGGLIQGRAILFIGAERFEAIVSPDFGTFDSFCCGEGRVDPFDAFHSFSTNGQVRHVNAATPHNHLFGASATTDGRMAFNLADQSGTIVTPSDPPHDPHVGLIVDLPANAAIITLGASLPKSAPSAPGNSTDPDELELQELLLKLEAELSVAAANTANLFRLESNYPNPFNPTTTIAYELRTTAHVAIKVVNALGEEVATLLDQTQTAGAHTVQWNAAHVPSGVYFVQVQAGEFKNVKKCLLLK